MEKYSNGSLAFYEYVNKKKNQRNLQKPKTRAWLSATRDFLFYACLLALSHSGRHERPTACTHLLYTGPIEGCSAAVEVRRYCCGIQSFLRGECRRRKASSEAKTSWLFVFLGGHMASRADDAASFDSVSHRRTPPQQSCLLHGWYSRVPCLGLRRVPALRTCHAHIDTRARASCCCCYGFAVLRLPAVLPLLLTRSRNTRWQSLKRAKARVLPGALRPAADSFCQPRLRGYCSWGRLGGLAPPQSTTRPAATGVQRSNF